MTPGQSFYRITSQPGDPQFELQSNSITGLTLRIPKNDIDIDALTHILQNKANSEFDKSIPKDVTIDEIQAIARRWTALTKPLSYLQFLVRHDEHPVGIAGLGWIGPVDIHAGDEDRAGVAGVMIQPFARGNGYAYEALRIVFDYGLRVLGLAEIRVGSYSGNLPILSLMEKKFGFQRETGAESVDQFGNDVLWIIRDHDAIKSSE